tara:strand:- start:2951 stop:4630 length:1680 start_codon:yes stop_codon:yes gene_type:complete
MALQGDGNGIVTLPAWVSSGDFTMSGKFTFAYTGAIQVAVGDNTSGTTWVGCSHNGEVKVNLPGISQAFTGFSVGDVVNWSVVRTGATNTITVNGVIVLKGSTQAVRIDTLCQFNSGSLKYFGELQDTLLLDDLVGDSRSYDFNQPAGTTNLPDSVGSQDGTLSGFTTGGFVGGVGSSINITSVANYSSLQRDGNGQALFTIAGTVAGDTVVEYQLDAEGWLTLDAAATTTFTGNVLVTGQQDVSVRLQNDIAINHTVTHLSATLSVPCWWQSNMAGRLTNLQTVTVTGSNPVPVMYKNGSFSELADKTAIDPLAGGSILPLIAQKYSDLGIPVCFANVAISNTGIDLWAQGTANYTEISDFFADVGGFEFTLSVGGEADTQSSMSQVDMETKLNALVNSLNTDFGSKHYLVDFPIGDGLGGTPAPIRAAFDSTIATNVNCLFGGDLSVIDIDVATTSGNDGLHIKSNADGLTATNIVWDALSGSSSTITITGIPDGSFLTTLITADRPSALIESVDRTYSGGSSTFSVNVPVGTQMYGVVRDNSDPSTDGAAINAVTV